MILMEAKPLEDHPISAHPPTIWQFMRYHPVTTGLILVCMGVAVWTQLGRSLTEVRWVTFVDLVDDPASTGFFPGWAEGQWWRGITPIFLHFGIVHIVFNMLWLYDLGGAIEARWRGLHLAVLVVLCGMIANAAQYFLNWDLQGGFTQWNALSGGMSGVVYGLFGYVWMRGRREPSLGLQLNQQTVLLMLGWLVVCMTGMIGNIANTGHLVGLLVGIAAGFWASPPAITRSNASGS
jgi:GlpG protein